MSALDEARAAVENARALIDALSDVADFGEDAFADVKADVTRVFNLLAPFAVPATSDEHEALTDVILNEYEMHRNSAGALARHILGAGFRRRGPITTAEPADSWFEDQYWTASRDDWSIPPSIMVAYGRAVYRAALEAAEAAR